MTFDPLADFFNGMNTNATGNTDRPRPCEGIGFYALDTIGPKKVENKGILLEAQLRIIRPAPGSQRKAGELVQIAWHTYKGPKEGGDNEKARGRDFVNALLGRPNMTPAAAETAMFSGPTQPGKGLLIQIESKAHTFTYKKGEKMGQQGTGHTLTYTPVPGQSNESVAKLRAQIDAWAGADASPQGAPHTATVPGANPAAPPPAAPPPAADPFAGMFSAPAAAPVAAPVAPAPAPTADIPAGSPLAFLFKQ